MSGTLDVPAAASAQRPPPPDARGGALLGAAVVVIWNDVADEGHGQFYAWHDHEHLPERLAIPGFARGRRFAKPGHSPRWLTLYEAESLDVLVAPAYVARLNAPTPLTRAALAHFRNTSRAVCRVACSRGGSSGGHLLALRFDVPSHRVADLEQSVRDDLFPAALASGGIVACHLCHADPGASYLDTAESSTRRFDVPPWVLLVEATTAAAAQRVHEGPVRAALDALGATVRPDAAVYALEICRLRTAEAG